MLAIVAPSFFVLCHSIEQGEFGALFSDRVLTDLLATGRTVGSAVAAREIFSSYTVILHLQITVFSISFISAKQLNTEKYL